MAIKETNAVVAPVTGAPAKAQRIACTLISIQDEVLYNKKADGSQGAAYHRCVLETPQGKRFGGTIPDAVAVKPETVLGESVNCEVGTVNGEPILRVLGAGSARPTWADLGLEVPNFEAEF
jgi:hypothetical protein